MALQAADLPALPAWMEGCWQQESDDRWSEECWTGARGGVMLGAARSGKGDAADWWEHSRVERAEGKLRFCALPKGQPGACFAATKVAADEIVFENPDQDFPTRIAYRKDGMYLLAEISGPGGANLQRWRYSRLPSP